MPQIKPEQPFYFLHKLVLAGVLAGSNKKQAALPKNVNWLVYFACYPDALLDESLRNERELFITGFAKEPDAVLEVVNFARKLAVRHRIRRKSQRAIAFDFLLNHNVLIKKGTAFFLLGDQRLTEADRKKAGCYRLVYNLTDDEISTFLNVSTGAVKKARQSLNRKGTL